jgi:hypothetical protein
MRYLSMNGHTETKRNLYSLSAYSVMTNQQRTPSSPYLYLPYSTGYFCLVTISP